MHKIHKFLPCLLRRRYTVSIDYSRDPLISLMVGLSLLHCDYIGVWLQTFTCQLSYFIVPLESFLAISKSRPVLWAGLARRKASSHNIFAVIELT